jgi:ribonuclease-3
LIDAATRAWLTGFLGFAPRDEALAARALTHGSAGSDNYERLEFLGDRVLGVTIAQWLYEAFPLESEGQLSRRLNSLVARETCAAVARAAGLPPHLRLGKQARDDGAIDSDNVLGDVIEALIGVAWIEGGVAAAETLVRHHWAAHVTGAVSAPRHPKSALQEWAAAHRRKPPVYEILDRAGPHHALRFTVRVTIANVGAAQAEGGSKQEAETAAAAALLEQLA